MRKIDPRVILESVKRHPLSMADAARECGLPFMTFKRRAEGLGVYAPNPSGKGRKIPGRGERNRVDVYDIIEGRVHFPWTSKLKKKLYKAGIKKPECEKCGQTNEWNGEPLVMHMDHIDGDNTNNLLINLQILCPNCHTQTDTFAGRNIARLRLLKGG